PPRMLVIPMADLMTDLPGERRYEHSVVVDEFEISACNQDVAVLQIAMRDAVLLQSAEHLHPPFGKIHERDRILDVRLDGLLQCGAVDPFHFQDGIPLATNTNPSFEKLEADCIGQR